MDEVEFHLLHSSEHVANLGNLQSMEINQRHLDTKDDPLHIVNKICRACLCVSEQTVNMQDTYFEDTPSFQLYEDICKVKIEADIFPALICTHCLQQLKPIHDFIEKVKHSYLSLDLACRHIAVLIELKDNFDLHVYNQKVANVLESIIRKTDSDSDIAQTSDASAHIVRGVNVLSDSDDDNTPLSEKLKSLQQAYESRDESNGEHTTEIKKRSPKSRGREKNINPPIIKCDSQIKTEFQLNICPSCGKKIRNQLKHMQNVHFLDTTILKCLKCCYEGDNLEDLIEHSQKCIDVKTSVDDLKTEDIKLYLNINEENDPDFEPNERFNSDEEDRNGEELDETNDVAVPRKSRNSKYLCKFCCETFYGYNNIEAHLKTVHSTESKCIICYLEFNNPFSLLYHMMVKHGQLKCCRLCLISFKTYNELNAHYKSAEHNTKCTVCGEQFKNRKAVYEHRRRKHLNPQTESQKFKCPECPREFANSNNIRRHILVAHNDMRFLCDTCGQSYTTKRNLTLHIQKFHQGIPVDNKPTKKNFFCESCGRELKIFHKYAIAMHRAKHKGHSFVCKKCYDSFATEEQFKEHVKDFGHELYECDKCQSQFVREENFKLHLKNHEAPGWNKNMFATWGKSAKLRNDKGEFVCSYCPKVFKDKQRLDNHVRVHTNERPYECHICGKGFKTWIHRKTHLNIHLGIKKWTCKYCSKAFTNSCTLKGHEMIHTGERPHRCPECRKGFITMSAMKKHRMTHFKTTTENGNKKKEMAVLVEEDEDKPSISQQENENYVYKYDTMFTGSEATFESFVEPVKEPPIALMEIEK
ncbi:zinc finger protein 85-like isoform X1 [Euwallacea fornicatus]|uniref:zinc finger protein 85-like isoform X1 n=2 Tax=Euwallacea fornicatus TaxID=995702 RepID=UPI00338E289A